LCKRGKFSQVETILLALGSNAHGPWGDPCATLRRAREELQRAGVRTVRASNLYWTQPLGDRPQAHYLNAVLSVQAAMAPAELLRLLKRIERRAGRTRTRFMAPRTLDIDILDHGGRRFGWPPVRRERGRLILPHPQLHERAFVLAPLGDVAPAWRHPALGLTAKSLLARLVRGGARQALDSTANTCDKWVS
jgi:2-amino-4-hydroxy-6-hydroxymethyldihydropteridine diphosphokinase